MGGGGVQRAPYYASAGGDDVAETTTERLLEVYLPGHVVFDAWIPRKGCPY